MVCIRCKMVVKPELEKLGLQNNIVKLGEVEIMENISDEQHDKFKRALLKSGCELIDRKKAVLIRQIINAIIKLFHYSKEPWAINFSDYLIQKLKHNYAYPANLFSALQGTTIGQCIISHKIERVKELLVYNEINLTEIAYLMHYSSVAHLSFQFRKVTGLTPFHFKQLKDKRLSMLEDIETEKKSG